MIVRPALCSSVSVESEAEHFWRCAFVPAMWADALGLRVDALAPRGVDVFSGAHERGGVQ